MSIKGGYILQPRSIDESDVSRFPPHVREIWLYLLRKANHAEALVSGTLIKRGQLMTSYKEIIDDLSWSVGYRKMTYKKHHCETATKLLTKHEMITTTKTTRGFIVTICKYDYYQDPKNYETDSETYSETDNETATKAATINKNEKKEEILHSKECANSKEEIANKKRKTRVKKESDPEKELNSKARETFEARYFRLFQTKYYWQAKDAGNMSRLIGMLKFQREQKGLTNDDNTAVIAAFTAFLNSAVKDTWIVQNFSISILASKFNEIVARAKAEEKERQKQYGIK